MKNLHTPNLTWIGSWWPKIWPHEYLISPIEISVNWPGSYNCLEPGQFTLISMGLIRYSCGHIFGHHEPIPTKFGVWRFFIMLYRNMKKEKNHENAVKKIILMTSSLWYSIGRNLTFTGPPTPPPPGESGGTQLCSSPITRMPLFREKNIPLSRELVTSGFF